MNLFGLLSPDVLLNLKKKTEVATLCGITNYNVMSLYKDNKNKYLVIISHGFTDLEKKFSKVSFYMFKSAIKVTTRKK